MAGPVARVLRRTDGYYMLPRSPPSPTVYGRTQPPPISGSLAARRKNDYVLTKGMLMLAFTKSVSEELTINIVSELEVVKPFAIKLESYGGGESAGMLAPQ